MNDKCPVGAALEQRVNDMADDTRELKASVFGNGNDGLRTKVDRLEQQAERTRISRSERVALYVAAATSVLTGTLMALNTVFNYWLSNT